MKKWFLLISYIIFSSQQITKAQQVIHPQNITTQLNDFLQMANRFYQFNGSAIISYRGKILLNKGYGFKNIAGNEMNDSGTIFQIGSVTKEFTSTIIMLLKEQGRLSLQDKLSDFFPRYPNGDKITIRQLLTLPQAFTIIQAILNAKTQRSFAILFPRSGLFSNL